MNVFQRRKLLGWAFIAVPVALIVLFYFYPMLSAFIMSLQSGKGANLSFVGLTNYKRLLSDPVFIQSLKNTLIFLIFQVPIMVVLAIFFSVLLNLDSKIKLEK